MKVGVPKEVKNHEYRVAITPIGVHELTAHGHEVFVEKGAGVGSQIDDAEYVGAGAKILDGADEVWGTADMVLKVKEPVAEEYHRMREGLTLFTYLHLAADQPLTEELLERKVTGIAYETVQLPTGGLPLLYPMSEVAGCLAPQVGAYSMLKAQGGRGVLMGGVGGVANAKVVIIGAGVSGQNAANIALGMGADVTLLDTDLDKLRMSFWRYNNRVHGLASSKLAIEQQVREADMVIGAVLIPGAKAPKLVSNELVSQMKPGSVLVDIAVDQGGCFEDTHPTTHADPTFPVHNSIFYCVANMPGAVPNTSTYALTNATLPYAVALADKGWERRLPRRPQPGAGPQHPRRLADQRARGRGRGHRRRVAGRGAGWAWLSPGRPCGPTSTTSRSSVGSRRTRCRRTAATCGGTPRSSTRPGSTTSTRSPRRRCRRSWCAARGRPPSTSRCRRPRPGGRSWRCAASTGSASPTAWPSPTRRRRPPAVAGRRLPKALPLADVEAILEAAGAAGTTLALRDRALLEILYGTGARISEAVGLDVDDLDRVDGTVLLRGKGWKERLVPGGLLRAGAAVDAYLTRARPELATARLHRAGRRAVPQRPRRPAVAAVRLDGAGQGRRPRRRDARRLAAHAASLVRHAPARGRRRRARRPGAAGPRVGDHHPDLHAGHGGQPARGLRRGAPPGVARGGLVRTGHGRRPIVLLLCQTSGGRLIGCLWWQSRATQARPSLTQVKDAGSTRVFLEFRC